MVNGNESSSDKKERLFIGGTERSERDGIEFVFIMILDSSCIS